MLKIHKIDVVNDSLSQIHSPPSSDHYFYLRNVWLCLLLKSTDEHDICENSDHYRPWLWIGRVDQLIFFRKWPGDLHGCGQPSYANHHKLFHRQPRFVRCRHWNVLNPLSIPGEILAEIFVHSVFCGALFFYVSRSNKLLTFTLKYFIHTEQSFDFLYYFYVLCVTNT